MRMERWKSRRDMKGREWMRMRRAGLLEQMVKHDSFSPNVFLYAGIAEAGLFVVGGFLYGAIPALQAEVSHLFTVRLTYVVSLKP
jgi:hypothetical protein